MDFRRRPDGGETLLTQPSRGAPSRQKPHTWWKEPRAGLRLAFLKNKHERPEWLEWGGCESGDRRRGQRRDECPKEGPTHLGLIGPHCPVG